MPQATAKAITATSAKITNITKNDDGSIFVEFGGEGQVFQSLEHIYNYVMQAQNVDNARMFLLGWWLARQPLGENTSLVIGKTLILDLNAPSPIKVQ
jgi:hypothetical protein